MILYFLDQKWLDTLQIPILLFLVWPDLGLKLNPQSTALEASTLIIISPMQIMMSALY
jgi:hypothetical protein